MKKYFCVLGIIALMFVSFKTGSNYIIYHQSGLCKQDIIEDTADANSKAIMPISVTWPLDKAILPANEKHRLDSTLAMLKLGQFDTVRVDYYDFTHEEMSSSIGLERAQFIAERAFAQYDSTFFKIYFTEQMLNGKESCNCSEHVERIIEFMIP